MSKIYTLSELKENCTNFTFLNDRDFNISDVVRQEFIKKSTAKQFALVRLASMKSLLKAGILSLETILALSDDQATKLFDNAIRSSTYALECLAEDDFSEANLNREVETPMAAGFGGATVQSIARFTSEAPNTVKMLPHYANGCALLATKVVDLNDLAQVTEEEGQALEASVKKSTEALSGKAKQIFSEKIAESIQDFCNRLKEIIFSISPKRQAERGGLIVGKRQRAYAESSPRPQFGLGQKRFKSTGDFTDTVEPVRTRSLRSGSDV